MSLRGYLGEWGWEAAEKPWYLDTHYHSCAMLVNQLFRNFAIVYSNQIYYADADFRPF